MCYYLGSKEIENMEYVIEISVTRYDNQEGKEVYSNRLMAQPEQVFDVMDNAKQQIFETTLVDQAENHEHEYLSEEDPMAPCLTCGRTKSAE